MTNPIEVVHELKESGFSQQQSETLVEAVLKLQTAQLATKADIADFRTAFAELKGEVNLLRWMTGTNLVLVTAVLVKLFMH